MKKLDKQLLDELIRLTRKYYKTSDTDLLPARIEVARTLSGQVFGDSYHWGGFCGFVSGIISGLNKDAGNDAIYKAFEAIGFRVKESEVTPCQK